jgi:hypothetical protein
MRLWAFASATTAGQILVREKIRVTLKTPLLNEISRKMVQFEFNKVSQQHVRLFKTANFLQVTLNFNHVAIKYLLTILGIFDRDNLLYRLHYNPDRYSII